MKPNDLIRPLLFAANLAFVHLFGARLDLSLARLSKFGECALLLFRCTDSNCSTTIQLEMAGVALLAFACRYVGHFKKPMLEQY